MLAAPRPAAAPPAPAVVLPADACRRPPPFPASIMAKLTPEELALLTERVSLNSKARRLLKAACAHKRAVVRVQRP